MKVPDFTEDDLKLIGQDVGGNFHADEGDTLIYGSHTYPSHRITVDKFQAAVQLAIVKRRSHIEVTDEEDVVAKVFRLFSRDGSGACKRSLWVRFDWTDKGWVASFYQTHGHRDAISGSDKLTEIPHDVADLAAEAFRRLALLNASGKTSSAAFSFPPDKPRKSGQSA